MQPDSNNSSNLPSFAVPPADGQPVNSGSSGLPSPSASFSTTAPVNRPLAPQNPSGGQNSLAFNPPVASAPVEASDTDLIEKEWVHHAKDIVAKTRDDPFTQSQELTKLKAEYLQKRYNKVLKLNRLQ
jgi:hypothetical protein